MLQHQITHTIRTNYSHKNKQTQKPKNQKDVNFQLNKQKGHQKTKFLIEKLKFFFTWFFRPSLSQSVITHPNNIINS
jgi:hypothetical protein